MNQKLFMIAPNGNYFTHLRLNLFPDDGISRLHVYGKVSKPILTSSPKSVIDLISKIYGGNCIVYSSSYNDTHPNHLIKPAAPSYPYDGWHTSRCCVRSAEGFPSHLPSVKNIDQMFGEEWVVFQLGYSGTINRIMIDTAHCVGKAPYAVRVQGIKEGIILDARSDLNILPWKDIVPYTIVSPGSQQFISPPDNDDTVIAYVKLLLKPDGCISRFRVYGKF